MKTSNIMFIIAVVFYIIVGFLVALFGKSFGAPQTMIQNLLEFLFGLAINVLAHIFLIAGIVYRVKGK